MVYSAYLNTTLNEIVYMRSPEGHASYGNRYWRLNRTKYGIRQSAREWNEKLNKELLKNEFQKF